jgi:hypothetical protein
MFCDGKCTDGEERCGLFWTITMEDKEGKQAKRECCGLLEMHSTLLDTQHHMLAVQQAAEERRNNDLNIGVAAVNAIDKGLKRMAKVALLKDNPQLALIEDMD